MNRVIGLVLTAFVLLCIVACRTQNSLPDASTVMRRDVTTVDETKFEFNTLNSKLSVSYRDKGNKMSVSGTMRIKHDSIIWLSVNAPILGFEALRIVLTKDSVKMLNKLSKEYLTADYNYVKKLINIDANYQIIEDILVGNSIEKSADVFAQDVRFDRENQRVVRMVIRSLSDIKTKLIADYKDFRMVDWQPLSTKMEFAVPDRFVRLNMEYSKVVVNKDNLYPFSVPASYTKISK